MPDVLQWVQLLPIDILEVPRIEIRTGCALVAAPFVSG